MDRSRNFNRRQLLRKAAFGVGFFQTSPAVLEAMASHAAEPADKARNPQPQPGIRVTNCVNPDLVGADSCVACVVAGIP